MSITTPQPPTRPIPRDLAYTCWRCGTAIPYASWQPCPTCHPIDGPGRFPRRLIPVLIGAGMLMAVLLRWAVVSLACPGGC